MLAGRVVRSAHKRSVKTVCVAVLMTGAYGQCDFRFDLFFSFRFRFRFKNIFFSFSFVLVFIIFSFSL